MQIANCENTKTQYNIVKGELELEKVGNTVEKKVANVSERLKLEMKDAQCSQSELSRMMRIDRAAISRYLSGAYELKQDRSKEWHVRLE